MNFTREPIIETIITPKDGYKILVRNSKGGGQEEYFVDAIEVVSFGHSFFFRSLERPKSFLVPVGDYEIIEVRETRVALKNVPIERSIKIGGGREAPVRGHKEPVEKEEEYVASESATEETSRETPSDGRGMDRKQRDRRRHRSRRRPEDQRDWNERPRSQSSEAPSSQQDEGKSDQETPKEEQKQTAPSFSTLFPPPPTLISQTLSRYKDLGAGEGSAQQQPVEEQKEHPHPKHEKEHKERHRKEDDSSGSEGTSLHRTHHMSDQRDPLSSSTSATRTSAPFTDTGFFQT